METLTFYQHALVPAKTECGCPSDGGFNNYHIRYPSYGGTKKKRKEEEEEKKVLK